MAVAESAVAAPESKTPYQLDLHRTNTACKVLLKNIEEERKRKQAESTKTNLLAGDDETNDEFGLAGVPVWMIVTTKKHIVDERRLKPGKLAIPHPLESTSSATICLITADPQRNFKDVIEHPSFPADLRPRITRVVGLSKLKAKCKQYEERRKLYAEHDIFLADDRVVTLLPQVLGKTFYQGGAKRPIPVNIAPPRKRDENGKTEKKAAKKSDGEGSSAASPENVAKEITKALSSALVHLAPGVSTSIKVAKANFTPEQVAENINAVLQTLTEKLITKGWRNIRSINIKGPETASYPIWEASELWVDEEDVLEEKKKTYGGNKGPKAIKSARKALNASLAIEDAKAEEAAETKLKRKAEDVEKPSTEKHTKKKRKAEVVDEKLSADLASKKDRLKKQKAEALAAVGQDVV